ncbi:hypothetical protein ABZ473_33310 [Streptomyces cellulosae]
MTVEHRWLLDETPWPEQAALVYGQMVELATPHPPIPELGWLGPGDRTTTVTIECGEDGVDQPLGQAPYPAKDRRTLDAPAFNR